MRSSLPTFAVSADAGIVSCILQRPEFAGGTFGIATAIGKIVEFVEVFSHGVRYVQSIFDHSSE